MECQIIWIQDQHSVVNVIYLSIDADALAVVRPTGFLLLRYSVFSTVELLSLLYLLFISQFICSSRLFIDKLGFFHANQITVCLDPHLNCG